VLLAFAIDFEGESEVSLAISANVLRLIGEEGVRVPDIRAWLASRRKLWRRR
jgi:hypothetical protein